ncbi:Hypothetical predicted protein, partial [Paramuricea clavata]
KRLLTKMADRRTQCLLEVTKRGFTLDFDPSGERNRCFYQCLGNHLGVAVPDVIDVLEKYMLKNRVVPVEKEDDSFATEDLWDFLSDVDFSALGTRPSTWEESVLGLRDEMANDMANDVVIRCAASLFSLNIHIIDWIGLDNVKTEHSQNPYAQRGPQDAWNSSSFLIISDEDEDMECNTATRPDMVVISSGDSSEESDSHKIQRKRKKEKKQTQGSMKVDSSTDDMDTTVNELSQVMSGLSSAESSPAKATKSLSGSFVDVEPKRLFTVKDDERNDKFIYQEGKRSYLNQDAVNKLESISVDKVPPAPNGPVKYRVKYVESDPLRAVSDNWNWGRAQPCPRKDFCNAGRRTLQICKGSFECVNPGCTYKKIQNTTNKVDFSKSKKCTHCKEIALHIECSARKYVENDRCHKKIMVIYVETHDCTPRADDSKPSKESVKEYLKTRPTSCAKQIQVDKVREALLSGKNCEEVNDVASQYSNQRHIQYLKTTIDKEKRPGGSDVEAIRNLKEDFSKRGLDENLIMEVGDDFVILSSATKIRLAALITFGIVTEPLSLDGCESLAKDFTEVEMTTYYPLLRRNVKLVNLFSPKPGENSTNVAKMVKTFDDAVNKMFPTVAEEYGLDPLDYIGRGLDPESYVGDEGGGLWKGLCQVKGRAVKNKTISDLFHFKQDVRSLKSSKFVQV